MDKNVILSIRGQQNFANTEPDAIELVTEGVLTDQGGGEYTLRYRESELTGLNDTLTTFQIEKGRITLLREGQVNSQMIFEENKRHLSLYETPYGTLTVGLDTRRMKIRLDGSGGEIEIDYAIEINNAVAGENIFRIQVRERDGKIPFQ